MFFLYIKGISYRGVTDVVRYSWPGVSATGENSSGSRSRLKTNSDMDAGSIPVAAAQLIMEKQAPCFYRGLFFKL